MTEAVAAVTSGLASFLSPCVLPLVPSYLTFLTGLSIDELQTPAAQRTALVHGVLFTLGFSLVFVALGFLATGFGQVVMVNRHWISRAGGVVIIALGLYLSGLLRWGALGRDRRLHLATKPAGYAGSVFVGVAFGAGWSPCLGPFLGAILMLASAQESRARGVGLLAAYSLGLAVPFVLSALAVGRFLAVYSRLRRHTASLSRVTGFVMVGIGLLMVTDRFAVLSAYLNVVTPDFLLNRL